MANKLFILANIPTDSRTKYLPKTKQVYQQEVVHGPNSTGWFTGYIRKLL
jgi:hypothetical protein